jgi:hypothetical protein
LQFAGEKNRNPPALRRVGQKPSATHTPARVYNSRSGKAWDFYASLRLRIGLADITVKPQVLKRFDIDGEIAEGEKTLPPLTYA